MCAVSHAHAPGRGQRCTLFPPRARRGLRVGGHPALVAARSERPLVAAGTAARRRVHADRAPLGSGPPPRAWRALGGSGRGKRLVQLIKCLPARGAREFTTLITVKYYALEEGTGIARVGRGER